MGLLTRLFDADTVTNWTPQRAHQAEREMLKREGIVVEPHYLWSRPAQKREQAAAWNRKRAMQPVVPLRANVAQWKTR